MQTPALELLIVAVDTGKVKLIRVDQLALQAQEFPNGATVRAARRRSVGRTRQLLFAKRVQGVFDGRSPLPRKISLHTPPASGTGPSR
jgi:hypothetical protein